MGDWIELIIFALFILSGLLFGGKKRHQPRPGQRTPSVPRHGVEARLRSVPERRVERPREVARPEPERAPAADALTVAEAVFEQIRRRMEPEAEAGPEPAAPAVPARRVESRRIERRPLPPSEGRSVETLTPAGGESHVEFHDRYIEPIEPLKSVEEWGRREKAGARYGRRTARQAMIWGAIFGKPKGLE
ncbi:MAG: hypothetical protein ACE5PT_07375 [Gemmatimonadales bacterium]